MKIAIIGAMQEELKFLTKNKNFEFLISNKNYPLYYNKINNLKILILQSGIGKVFAAIGTTLLIERFNPKIVINIGSAGSLVSSLNPGDIIIPSELCYHDVNLTSFGHLPGQIVGCPKFFKSNKKLFSLAKKIMIKENITFKTGLLCTGDSFIDNEKKLKYIQKTFPEAIAVEMEGAAIAQVCYQFNIPFLSIRSISDFVNDKKASHSFVKNLPKAAKQSNFVTELILKNLDKNSFIN